jgi:hypothetical protein
MVSVINLLCFIAEDEFGNQTISKGLVKGVFDPFLKISMHFSASKNFVGDKVFYSCLSYYYILVCTGVVTVRVSVFFGNTSQKDSCCRHL